MVTTKTDETGRWAPWWTYVVPFLALNYLRQILLPRSEIGDALGIALALVVALAVAVIVTAAYRLRHRPPTLRASGHRS